ncbi:probable RNA helicase armi, partial [Drosophila obscura]|uniref:probable RNA helicase armi n=1 Tax=Drosophila obscura TaxID=7282 RepID=UPI001BB2697F
ASSRTKIARWRNCYPEFTVFARGGYVLREHIPQGFDLQVGDQVLAHLIECDHEDFTHRAIRLIPPSTVLQIAACETQNSAEMAEPRLRRVASAERPPGRPPLGQEPARGPLSRSYANLVWSKRADSEVIKADDRTDDTANGNSNGNERRFLGTHLPLFKVPERLTSVYLRDCNGGEMRSALEAQYPCLKGPLTMANYVERFSLLLSIEELELFVAMRKFDRHSAYMERDGEYLVLQLDDLAERRPSLVVGDKVNVSNIWPGDNNTYSAIITKVLCNRSLLRFNASFHRLYNGEPCSIEFQCSRWPQRKQHYAIGKIVDTMGQQFLFPTEVVERKQHQLQVELVDGDDMYLLGTKLEWFNESLNFIQKRAVFHILRGATLNTPYVIFGPPGTGKSATLVEAVLQVVRNVATSRLLVVAPSNSAADLITKRIIASNTLANDADIIRLVSHNQTDKGLLPPELIKYCASLDMFLNSNMTVTASGLRLHCQWWFFTTQRIIVGTSATLGNLMQMPFSPGHFTHLFVDEAGQLSEPQILLPATLLAKDHSQVILAGDPQQLQPIIYSSSARAYGLDTSLLERLLQLPIYAKDLDDPGNKLNVLTKLKHNYRALPAIVSTYSHLFYEDELMPMVSPNDSRELQIVEKLQIMLGGGIPRGHGVFFVGVFGSSLKDVDSPSWHNPAEAGEIQKMYKKLIDSGITPEQIGIITPYAKQVKKIKALLNDGSAEVLPKIGSVEEFQGGERDIMMISTVRSADSVLLGFVRSEKRMNVAISRARAAMFIYGDPIMLATDKNWRHLMRLCVTNCSYFGACSR